MTRASHRSLRRERPLSRPGSVRAAGAVGQDGLAIRTGQLRSTRSRLTRLQRCSRIRCRALVVAVRGPAPRGASCDGPPAPRRLEQPSPCTFRSLTPLVVIAGTASPVPGPTGSWLDACLAAHVERWTRATETILAPCLAGRREQGRDAFRRVAIDRVAPTADAMDALWLESVARRRAPFSPRSRRPCASAQACGELLGQRRSHDLPCGSSCRATRDASDRLLPSHVLRTSTRASSALDVSRALARPAQSRRSPASRSGRFALVGRTSSSGDSSRWALSSRRDACKTEPLTPLSPPPKWSRRSRGRAPLRGPPRSPASHPRERGALPQ